MLMREHAAEIISPIQPCESDRAMSDRDYFKSRAETERAAADAALAARNMPGFHAHMGLAREYDWRAAVEPYPEPAEEQPVSVLPQSA